MTSHKMQGTDPDALHPDMLQGCDPDALHPDIIYSIAQLMPQTSVTALRETSKAMLQAVGQAWPRHLAPRTRLTELQSRKYRTVQDISLHRLDRIKASHIRQLAAFPELRSLSLETSRCRIRDEAVFTAIGESLHSLTSLNLRGCHKLSWPGLYQLTSLSKLQELDVAGLKFNTSASNVFMHFPNLRTLRLGDGKVLSYADNDVLMHLGINCKNLTHLDLAGCIDVTDTGVEYLAALSSTLTHLSLQSVVRLSPEGLTSCLLQLTNLQSLNLRGCLQLFDEGLGQLKALTKLTELSTQGCNGIIGAGFAQLSTLTQLRVLNAKDCQNIDSLTGVAWLNTLHKLDLSRCNALKCESLLMIGHLSALTELRLKDLKLPGRAPHPDTLNKDLEKWLRLLRHIQVLDLSGFYHQHGIPPGLLSAVGRMTTLKHLSLADVAMPAYTPLTTPADSALAADGSVPTELPNRPNRSHWTKQHAIQTAADMPQVAIAHVAAGVGNRCSHCRAGMQSGQCCQQLLFLTHLRQLEQLDLSGWSGLSPCALFTVSRLTKLNHLKLNRLGNDLVAEPESAKAVETVEDGEDAEPDAAPVKKPMRPTMRCTCHRLTVRRAHTAWNDNCVGRVASCLECLCGGNTGAAGGCGDVTGAACAESEGESEVAPLTTRMGCLGLSERAAPAAASPAPPAATAKAATAAANRGHSAADLEHLPLLQLNCYLSYLSQLTQLKELHLEAVSWLTDLGVTVAVLGMPTLDALHLNGSPRVTGSCLQSVGRTCVALHTLMLNECPALEEEAVAVALPQLTRLGRLELGGCRGLGGDQLCAAVGKIQLPHLETLSLRGCGGLDARSMHDLVSGARRLRHLDLSHCASLDDPSLSPLVTSLPCLSTLDVGHCWRLTRPVVRKAALALRGRVTLQTGTLFTQRKSNGALWHELVLPDEDSDGDDLSTDDSDALMA